MTLNLTQTRLTGWLGTAARLLLAVALFLWSIPKLGAPREFKQALRAFDLLPEWMAKGVAYGAPTLVVLLAVLLVLGIGTRVVAGATAVLALGLLVLLLQSAARGLYVDSGIFGVGGPSTSEQSWLPVLYALALLVLALFVFLYPQTMVSVDDFLARHDYVEAPSAKRLRDAQGRRKYEAAVAAKARAAVVRSRYISGSIIIVGLAVVLAGVGVLANVSKIKNRQSVAAVTPHGVEFGKAAAADVEIVYDLQSAPSTSYLAAVGSYLESEVRANRAQAHYHVIANLDHSKDGTGYSSVAANATICAAAISPDFFVALTEKLVTTRPSSQNGGSVADLLRVGNDVGKLSGDDQTGFRDCVQTKAHLDRVRILTEEASKDGIVRTPVVTVNGKPVAATLDALKAAIAEAGKTGPAPSPSVTPSPSGSESASGSPSASAS